MRVAGIRTRGRFVVCARARVRVSVPKCTSGCVHLCTSAKVRVILHLALPNKYRWSEDGNDKNDDDGNSRRCSPMAG